MTARVFDDAVVEAALAAFHDDVFDLRDRRERLIAALSAAADALEGAKPETFKDELDAHIAESMADPEYRAAYDAAIRAEALAPVAALDGRSLIAAERGRQYEAEPWSLQHDIQHGADELRRAARCYFNGDIKWWPWDAGYWKPKDRLSDLIRAGALFRASRDVMQALGRGVEYRDSEEDRCVYEIDLLLDKVRALIADPDAVAKHNAAIERAQGERIAQAITTEGTADHE